MIGLRDAQALQPKLLEFQSKLWDANSSALAAQQQQFTLLETVRELKEEVARLKNWEAEKKRYELKHIPPSTQVLAYALKAEMQGSEPMYYICAACHEKGKKSILQPETRFPGRSLVMVCHPCGSSLYLTGGARA
jgi:hypothetical protein